MPLRNRVTPLGELIATPARGLVFGNRGRLHDDHGRVRRRFVGRRWIACRLEFRGRYRGAMPPGRYTGLFFLDEATALAAGHRPCAECRHEDYVRFVEIYGARADVIDARLHAERIPRTAGSAATVITPRSLVDVLRAGWTGSVPFLHPSASKR